MKAAHKLNLRQALVLMVVIIGLAGSVTYALLQSQLGIFRENTIQTAVASLQVGTDGTTYGSSIDGYAFGNLVPGGQAQPSNGYPIYVKNVGTTPLALKLGIKGPITNPDNVNLQKVHLIVTSAAGGPAQNFTLQDLIDANSAGGMALSQATRLIPSQVFQISVQVSMDADAVSGPSAMLSAIDFNFGAIAVN